MKLQCDPQANSTNVVQVIGDGAPLPAPLDPTNLVISVYRSSTPVFNSDAVTVHSGRLRTVPAALATGVFLDILDTDPPFNTAFFYLVMGLDPTGKSVLIHSIPGCPTVHTIPYGDNIANCVPVLLSDPAYPNLMAWAGLMSIDPLSYPARRELYEPYGRRYPVAVSNVRSGARTSIRLLTRTRAARAEMLAVTEGGGPICFRLVDHSYPEAEELLYISVGDITESRIFEDHRKDERIWTLEVAAVQRPVVGVVSVTRSSWGTYAGKVPGVSGKTWDGLILEGYTWNKLQAGEAEAGSGRVAFAQPGEHAVAEAWREP